jgi:hypothetical protein
VETVFRLFTTVCHLKKLGHYTEQYVTAHLAYLTVLFDSLLTLNPASSVSPPSASNPSSANGSQAPSQKSALPGCHFACDLSSAAINYS